MKVTVEQNQTSFDLAMMTHGNLDRYVPLLLELGIETMDTDLTGMEFELPLDPTNIDVMEWFKNAQKINIGEQLELDFEGGDFNDDFNDDFNNQENM